MDTTEYGTPLSKALLTGLFLGLAATLVSMIFGVIYRRYTGFEVFEFINFPVLIFGTNSLLSAIGVSYFYFRKFFRNGNTVYVTVFIIGILVCLYGINHADIGAKNKALASGVTIIIGVAILMIPLLYGNKKFLKSFI